MTPELWSYLQTGGTTALLIVLLYGGSKGWWAFGWVVTRLQADLDAQKKETQRWQDECLHLLKLASKTIDKIETGKQ